MNTEIQLPYTKYIQAKEVETLDDLIAELKCIRENILWDQANIKIENIKVKIVQDHIVVRYLKK